MLTYISNAAHYTKVLSRVQSVKHTLWIGTAGIKDLYVNVGREKKPFLALIAMLIRRGVDVRLIHAKEPGPNFREDFDKYPVLYDRLERVLCPRVHFKMLVFDGKEVYIGSANLTGAGIGMKTDNKLYVKYCAVGIFFIEKLVDFRKNCCNFVLGMEVEFLFVCHFKVAHFPQHTETSVLLSFR